MPPLFSPLHRPLGALRRDIFLPFPLRCAERCGVATTLKHISSPGRGGLLIRTGVRSRTAQLAHLRGMPLRMCLCPALQGRQKGFHEKFALGAQRR
jgi:hypothetical protein